MGGGDFTQGLAGGIQNAMQMRQQAMDNQMRADYMKSQKKLLDAQYKAAEIEAQFMESLSRKDQSPGIAPVALWPQSDKPGQSGIPSRPGLQFQPEVQPRLQFKPGLQQALPPMALPENISLQAQSSQPQIGAGEPSGGGMVDIITRAQTEPIFRAMVKKVLGIDFGAQSYDKEQYMDNGVLFERTVDAQTREPKGPPRIIKEKSQETAQQKFTQAKDLRKEFVDSNKEFRDVRNSWARVQESAESPSAAGDLALIFNYMKMLDPGSTVREGEFANAQNSGGVPDMIRAQYNKIMRGERLSDDMRGDFTNRAEMLYNRQVDQYKQSISEYTRLAQRMGIDPREVIVDLSLVPAKRKQKPDLGLGKKKTGGGTAQKTVGRFVIEEE